ncbi:DUF6944 family repetitive protein [Bacillus sp. SG-1]|uniref:DUF6944 family repetitive protein n=1 Tax=Bacillus sp. SG-1 TaxID=161544 RepID=UPI00015447FD|nr:hypothetical protein [Bacillus sp. SG-1]EDL63093.1 hypothetical protein BSG1_13921 [Bacillus sp. SG-1]
MDRKTKGYIGGWIQAIGTVLSAISSTSSLRIGEEQSENLNLIGNLLQASGSALAADSEKEPTLSKIGNEIQAIGNSLEVGAVLLTEGTVQDELVIKGDLLQALGAASAFADNWDSIPSEEALLSLYGNLLGVIGNSLQAISGIFELEGEKRQHLNSIGSWIQAIGGVLSALSSSVETLP